MDKNFETVFATLCEHRDRMYDENGERRMTVGKALDIYTDIVNQLTDDEKREFYRLTGTIRLVDACRDKIDWK